MSAEPFSPATVVSFDREVGLGTLRTAEGTDLSFHAVAVVDGSRDVAVGTDVLCARRSGHAGSVEACLVIPLTGRPAPHSDRSPGT